MLDFWRLVIFGFLIGVLASMTGVGGGVFIVPILTFFYAFVVNSATGTSLTTIIFTAIASTVNYAKQKRIYYKTGLILVITTAPGAYMGAWLATIMEERLLGLVFGVFLILVAARTSISVFRKKTQDKQSAIVTDTQLIHSGKTIALGVGLGFFGRHRLRPARHRRRNPNRSHIDHRARHANPLRNSHIHVHNDIHVNLSRGEILPIKSHRLPSGINASSRINNRRTSRGIHIQETIRQKPHNNIRRNTHHSRSQHDHKIPLVSKHQRKDRLLCFPGCLLQVFHCSRKVSQQLPNTKGFIRFLRVVDDNNATLISSTINLRR